MNSLKILLILLVLFILFSKSSVLRQDEKTFAPKILTPTPVLEEKTPTPIPTKIPIQTNTIIENTPTFTSEVKQVQGISNTWVYPNSQQLSNSGNAINLQSYDDVGQITNWYKERIREIGMNAVSFVSTSTNGNVLNKLSGADEHQEIGIEITKQASSQLVEIRVVQNTF
ncbi:MAG: hypothetical protein V1697_01570 [Candidatus Levyibacteriota bacterium]